MPMTRVVPIGLPGNGTVLDWTAQKPQISDTGHKPVVRQNQISGGYATPWSIIDAPHRRGQKDCIRRL